VEMEKKRDVFSREVVGWAHLEPVTVVPIQPIAAP
jgi:hypothetical protein